MTKDGACKRSFKPGEEMIEESFFPFSNRPRRKRKISKFSQQESDLLQVRMPYHSLRKISTAIKEWYVCPARG